MRKSGKASRVREKVVEETKKFTILFVYLFFFLGAFTTYKQIILLQYQLTLYHYSYNFVEAMILAKVILLGSALHLGDRFRNWPLFLVSLYKTLLFTILVVAFSLLEHIVNGLLHGKGLTWGIHIIMEKNKLEILGDFIILFVAFVPLFAVWGLSQELGDNRLYELFFTRRRQ